MTTTPEDLLGAYATDTLNPEERRALMEGALRDDQVFEALVAEESLRELLTDASVRQSLHRELASPTRTAAWFATLTSWRVLAPASLAAAAAVALLVVRPEVPSRAPSAEPQSAPAAAPAEPIDKSFPLEIPRAAGSRTLSEIASPGSPEIDDWVFQATPAGAAVTLDLDRSGERPQYRQGDSIRITFAVRETMHVIILERRGGDTIRLFPNQFIFSTLVTGGDTHVIPPNGLTPLRVDAMPGVRRIRALAAPQGIDVDSIGDLKEAERAGRLTIVERSYTVD